MAANTAWLLGTALGGVAVLGFLAKYLRVGNCTGPCDRRRRGGYAGDTFFFTSDSGNDGHHRTDDLDAHHSTDAPCDSSCDCSCDAGGGDGGGGGGD